MSFGPQCTIIGCTLPKFKDYLQACTRSDETLMLLRAKQSMGSQRGPTPDKNHLYLKDNYNIPTMYAPSLPA